MRSENRLQAGGQSLPLICLPRFISVSSFRSNSNLRFAFGGVPVGLAHWVATDEVGATDGIAPSSLILRASFKNAVNSMRVTYLGTEILARRHTAFISPIIFSPRFYRTLRVLTIL